MRRIFIGFALVVASLGTLALPRTGEAGDTKKAFTFKNKSAVTANDFHFSLEDGGLIKNASARLGNIPAFRDTALTGSPSLYWKPGQSLLAVPAGQGIRVHWVGAPKKVVRDSVYFTLNGVKLAPAGLLPVIQHLSSLHRIVPDGDGTTGTVIVKNDNTESVSLSTIRVFINNSDDPNAIGEFIPDGELLVEEASVDLAPGDSVAFAYWGADPARAVCVDDLVAFSSATEDEYYELTAGAPGQLGACCVGEACFAMTGAECMEAGGDYQGDGTNCDTTPCVSTATEPVSWGTIKSLYR